MGASPAGEAALLVEVVALMEAELLTGKVKVWQPELRGEARRRQVPVVATHTRTGRETKDSRCLCLGNCLIVYRAVCLIMSAF